MKRGHRHNLLLLGCSIVLAVTMGEVVSRAVFPPPLPWLYPQFHYRADPDLVFALAPNQDSFAADKPIRTNSRGLREAEFNAPSIHERLRLLWLGDSIVFGYGVSDQDVVTHRVEVLLEQHGMKAETVNTAVPGYNTEQEVQFLTRQGVSYHPDWVIVGFCWNDINDQVGARVCPNGWLVSGSAEGACEPSFWDSADGYAIRNLVKRSRLAYATLEGMRSVRGMMSPEDHSLFRSEVFEGRDTNRVRTGWERVDGAFEQLRVLSESRGFIPLIVAFPLPLSMEREFPRSSYPSRLREIASRHGLRFLDLEPAFRKAFQGHESLFIAYDADHPNAAGHDVAAQAVVDLLLESRKERAIVP